MAGQAATVHVCAATAPASVVSGPIADAACPAGESLYLVRAYLVSESSSLAIDASMEPVDPAQAAWVFGYGFAIVMFFFLLGVVGHAFLGPFWGKTS